VALAGGGLQVTVRLPVRAQATMAIPPAQAALPRPR
jgi:hypothetical protein